MKKNLKFLTLLTLVTSTNSIPILLSNNMAITAANNINNDVQQLKSKVNMKNTISLNEYDKPDQRIMQKRGYYTGTYYDTIKDNPNFSVSEKEQIKNWTDYLLSPSKNQTAIHVKKYFPNYDSLKEKLNPALNLAYQKLIASYNNCSSEKKDSWVSWDKFWKYVSSTANVKNNHIDQHNKLSIEELILFYYNFMIKNFPKTEDINKFVNSISFLNILQMANSKRVKREIEILGVTYSNVYFNYKCSVRLLNKTLGCDYKEKVFDKIWIEGQFSTNHHLHVLIHELGHTFNNYDKYNFFTLTDQAQDVITFLKSKSIDFGDFSWLKNDFYKLFSLSTYGESDIAELISEGFAYWLLTPSNERTKGWDLWNEYFLSYLPQQRKNIKQISLDFTLENGDKTKISLY